MGEKKDAYYWKCPECGTEQKVTSAYFLTDCVSNEKCCSCRKRVHCLHPAVSFKKKKEDVIAYSKD